MTLVIGLTGSIATGKSTVSRMVKGLGIPVIDADLLAREVVEPGETAYLEILNVFGKTILQPDRTIDRKALGQIVFSNERKRQQLNRIVHPAVRDKMIEQRDAYISQHVPCVVLDIPLLFEGDLGSFADKTLVVFVDEEKQLERLMSRDRSSASDALKRIGSQISINEKATLADAVIDNNFSKEKTKQQLLEALRKWGINYTERA